ncbi:MAG: helix-turn-helix domain-containing protein [Rhodocyclales bacterium]|nr:helix-turn-helix domain-containing protein [Rhodocyclales bacterium]
MSENEAGFANPVPEAPGPGALLRQAREARGMSVDEVAASLKMSRRQIEAMETEEFARLSGATFVRGFIRNYAKLLRIDAAQVLAALEAKTELPKAELTAPGGSGVRMPSGSEGPGHGLLVATSVALALLAVAVALYFNVIDLGTLLGPGGAQEGRAASRPLGEAQVVQPIDAVVHTPPVEGGLPPQPVVAAAKPDRQLGDRQLVFSFEGDSWVEVKDASGRIIFSQLNRRGTTEAVLGRPPFELVVGNASQVRLQYEDQPIDLGPHTRVEVARVTLE